MKIKSVKISPYSKHFLFYSAILLIVRPEKFSLGLTAFPESKKLSAPMPPSLPTWEGRQLSPFEPNKPNLESKLYEGYPSLLTQIYQPQQARQPLFIPSFLDALFVSPTINLSLGYDAHKHRKLPIKYLFLCITLN